MVATYKASPKYTKLPAETRSSYDRMLKMVSVLLLKDGRAFGTLTLASITPGAADRLHERIKVNPKGGERVRTAVLAMKVCQRAWNVARRSEPKAVPSDNPFQKMDRRTNAKRAAERKERWMQRHTRKKAPKLSGQILLCPRLSKPVARLQFFGRGFMPPAVAAEIEFRRRQRGHSGNSRS